jgi:hypothetical protein
VPVTVNVFPRTMVGFAPIRHVVDAAIVKVDEVLLKTYVVALSLSAVSVRTDPL